MTGSPITYVAAAGGETLVVGVDMTGGGSFTAYATINLQRSLELTANAEATIIPNAGNPSNPGKTMRTVTSFDWKVSGQGTLNIGDDVSWANWLLSGVAHNVQVANANTGGIVMTGMGVLTMFSASSDGIGKKVTASITIEGADLPVVTAHA